MQCLAIYSSGLLFARVLSAPCIASAGYPRPRVSNSGSDLVSEVRPDSILSLVQNADLLAPLVSRSDTTSGPQESHKAGAHLMFTHTDKRTDTRMSEWMDG